MKRTIIFIASTLLAITHLFADSSLVGTTFNAGNGEYYMCYIITSDEVDNRTAALYKLPPNERRQLSGDVTIPESVEYSDNTYTVTSIQREALMQTLVTSVTIPSTVTTIEPDAFWGCSQLVSVYVPSSVVSIDTIVGIVNACYNFQAFIVDPNNQKYCSEDGILFDKTKTTIVTYPAGKTQSTYSIPNTVTQIANSAFYKSKNLESITIPNSVEKIGKYAFNGCSKISSIVLPNSVISLGDGAFEDCDSLTTVTISDNLEYMGAYPFAYCEKLESISIPSKIVEIPLDCFRFCHSLSSVTISEGVKKIGERAFDACSRLTTIDLPNSIDTIRTEAFKDCYSLSSITIPDGVSYIGASAFWGCGIKSFDIPTNLLKIEERTFGECRKLDSITIPENITNIGYEAFRGCDITIAMLSSLPPENETAFLGGNYTIYVPCGSLDAYLQKWGCEYWLRYRPTPYSLDLTCNLENLGLLYYPNVEELTECDSIIEIAAENSDYNYHHFARWSDGNTDNPRQIPFNDNIQLTAIYELDTFLIHDYIGEDGYTTGGGYYKYGEEITVTVHPNYGYDFLFWEDGSTTLTWSFVVGGEMILNPIFVKHQFRLNITFDDTKGWVNYYGGEFLLEYLTEIQLEATPHETYEFERWSDGNTDNPRTMIIDRDIELTAYFREASEGIEDIHIDSSIPHKIIIDGQVYILRGDKTYTLTGQEIIVP